MTYTLTICDPNPDVTAAMREIFLPWSWPTLPPTPPPSEPIVHVRNGLFEEIDNADGFATAGNSFGLMDGGVDAAVAKYDDGIETAVQSIIRHRWRGELPVGAAIAVHMRKPYRWLIYAPTMRVPMVIAGTDQVYTATWAALNEAKRWHVKHLVIPGFGTTTGKVPPRTAARQMATAWRNFHRVPHTSDWATATERHRDILAAAAV